MIMLEGDEIVGKILVIEGTDCSGKTTQYEKLCERLKAENVQFASNSFPAYNSEGCFFVKEYLAGKFGEKPSDVDAFTASVFYSLDRYYSFKMNTWGRAYENGGNILFARYISSNVLHHACKLKSNEEREKFIDWLYDFENNLLKIPKEDNVILLYVPFELTKKLKEKRGATSSGTKDIHEMDEEYLRAANEASLWVANKLGWTVIYCTDENGNLRSIEDIHEEIYKEAMALFE